MVMDSRVSRDGEPVGTGSHRDRLPEGGVGTPPTPDPGSEATLISPGPLNCCRTRQPPDCPCPTSRAVCWGPGASFAAGRANKLLAASRRHLSDVFFSSRQLRGYLWLGHLEGALCSWGAERGREDRELDPWLLVGDENI